MAETETPAPLTVTDEGIHVFKDSDAATKWVDAHMVEGKPDPMVAAIFFEIEGAPVKRSFKALGKNDRIEMKSLVDGALRKGKEPGIEYAGVKYFAYEEGGKVIGGAVQWRPGSSRWHDVPKASAAQLARWRQRDEKEAEAAADAATPSESDAPARPARINPQAPVTETPVEEASRIQREAKATGLDVVVSPHDIAMDRRAAEPPTVQKIVMLFNDACLAARDVIDDASKLYLETMGSPPEHMAWPVPNIRGKGWRAALGELAESMNLNLEGARAILREVRGL